MAVLQDANGDYLIENHTISIALSIQVLDLTQQQGEPDGNQTEVLIVGDSDMPTIWDAQTK